MFVTCCEDKEWYPAKVIIIHTETINKQPDMLRDQHNPTGFLQKKEARDITEAPKTYMPIENKNLNV